MFEAVEANRLVADWHWLENHKVLPRAGGLLEQDPKWVEAMELIGAEITTLQNQGVADGKR